MRTLLLIAALVVLGIPSQPTRAADPPTAAQVFQSVASHRFHPLNNDGSFTSDRQLDKHGIASLDDEDWKIRLLAIRDLLLAFPIRRSKSAAD